MPYPRKKRGEKHKIHTTEKRRISGPGSELDADIAESVPATVRQRRARLARSASRSPLRSIRSMMEYLELRMLVWIARSISEIRRSDAPSVMIMEL